MLSLAPKTPPRGFSLIELIIAIAIISVVVAIAMPGYATWVKNSRVRTAAESIQNGLQTARAEAIKRNLAVKFVLASHSAWCITTSNCTTASDTLQSRTASEGSSSAISVTTAPSDSTEVEFNNLGSVSASPVPFSQVDLNLTGADRPLRVTLGVGGNTRLCDPSSKLKPDDPRRC